MNENSKKETIASTLSGLYTWAEFIVNDTTILRYLCDNTTENLDEIKQGYLKICDLLNHSRKFMDELAKLQKLDSSFTSYEQAIFNKNTKEEIIKILEGC